MSEQIFLKANNSVICNCQQSLHHQWKKTAYFLLTNIVLSTDGVSLQIGDIKTQKVVIDECVTKEY